MSFIKYDIALLVLFVIFVSIFLYRERSKIKKEGLLFLYKTSWGIKLIDKTAKKFPKIIHFFSYVCIVTGYLLMAGMIYLFGKIFYTYISNPIFVREIKIPPITPLFPYLPQAFKLDFLPPFYFIYFIIVLAIVAISHEFAHGIFMRRYNIHIKSTGFGFFPFFLPVFLAAFVEQDEKSMVKATKFQQKAVLAAGTFANILTAIISFGIMILFFSLAFNPSGVIFEPSPKSFSNYAYGLVSFNNITSINNISKDKWNYEDIKNLTKEEEYSLIKTKSKEYLINKEFLNYQKPSNEYFLAYLNSPAIRNNLSGIIFEINNKKINNLEDLINELDRYSPGDEIFIKTKQKNEIKEYNIILEKHPLNEKESWLGIGFSDIKRKGFIGKVINVLSFKDPRIYYESSPINNFIYSFLWWLVLISFSVALVNMLPMGIFDGGRFFYLTIWELTGSEKKAKLWFGIITYVLLVLIILMMLFWVFSFTGLNLFK